MRGIGRTLLWSALVALVALAALGGKASAEDEGGSASGETIIELRIWQHIGDTEDVWLSARRKGGRWDALGTIPFPLVNHSSYRYVATFHRYADLAIGGVELRVWQRYSAPELIFVRACTSACPSYEYPPGSFGPEFPDLTEGWSWTPLGMVPVPLDDGLSSSGNYRYGNVTIAVPAGNPGLLSDREHLLALRDAMAGEATLHWSAGTPTAVWEGVVVEGVPPRVTRLQLQSRGLTGEIWGWLGELTELTALRLDGNQLTGAIPSKLSRLTKLTDLRLAGNDLQGCVPPPLRAVEHHDWDLLDLPACSAPVWLTEDPLGDYKMNLPRDLTIGGGTYRWHADTGRTVIFDVMPGLALNAFELVADPGDDRDFEYCAPCFEGLPSYGLVLAPAGDGHPWGPARRWPPNTWVILDLWDGEETVRSHNLEASPLEATFAERIIASVWTTATGEQADWTWE